VPLPCIPVGADAGDRILLPAGVRALAVPCTFAGYINERLTADIPTALRFATALVSLKMETPGPFTGTRADVDAYLKEFY
jgi:hypothetical protein